MPPHPTHSPPTNTPISSLTAFGRLCERCDGKCVICDSYVRPCTLVRVCDECNYGSAQGRCVVCGQAGVSDAYYCKECVLMEKDVCKTCHTPNLPDPPPTFHPPQRDGCPKVINLGSARTDMYYEKKQHGFTAR